MDGHPAWKIKPTSITPGNNEVFGGNYLHTNSLL